MQIKALPALEDNYIWLIEKDQDIIVVDPGESDDLLKYLNTNGLNLKAVLLTHFHEDHVGGLDSLLASQKQEVAVYGPVELEERVDYVVREGDHFTINQCEYKVIKTAGHSEEHVSYLMDSHLFCGDALFSAGCGRVFTNDYQAQFETIQKIKALPDTTKIYAGHEYTLTNLAFALTVEPNNQVLMKEQKHVKDIRSKGIPSLPSTVEREKQINLFLQVRSLTEFIQLRKARDQF
ncbi:hydroxyacylglutathione hydrolase [Facklamia miroungae]|uniref:Hydroxyacylglutathione hydrolase n=1 Tax=Facklamia miroungae TaxID=120956 RepID=A0A1G7QJS7_9LACT|nr:hydroxyacylglutathione hydrolase [Facklamia miroungae]NKZ28968.1 hydroxyacylglutathione hydrolase [Facklamia miroungae]SDF98797.1 hydroxyacylglutathione hydrolase [Facklamia miroungae]